MIARKITYTGNFNQDAISTIYDITRKTEITGQVMPQGNTVVVLNLEGDASQIKLLQHQIERKIKTAISGKNVEPIPYQYYVGVTFLP